LKFGVHIPNIGEYADPQLLVSMAQTAEERGWDGVFVWDHVLFDPVNPIHVIDPWVGLAAVAQATTRVTLGTMVTPPARRRPWKLAREVATLDRLSGGRVVFGAGLGVPRASEYEMFGEDGDAHVRAQRLDEGLAVLSGLLSGERFSFAGEHFQVGEVQFLPAPISRVPIWVAGRWPNPRPFERAARWDGVVPEKVGGPMVTTADVADLVAFVARHREGESAARRFDVVIGGSTLGEDRDRAHATVAGYAAAGATWWMERVHWRYGTVAENIARIEAGPPTRP
jgi:alkanesulfonate monooxygenase SsuD/methylene tetrahydromethanopterin reductase-like flavin-dependent oxidoreductase (luciferase family)